MRSKDACGWRRAKKQPFLPWPLSVSVHVIIRAKPQPANNGEPTMAESRFTHQTDSNGEFNQSVSDESDYRIMMLLTWI